MIVREGIQILQPDVVLTGGASGVDEIADRVARELNVPTLKMLADWKGGAKAGIERNKDMLKQAHKVVAIWDGESHGTMHMIGIAKAANKLATVFELKPWGRRVKG